MTNDTLRHLPPYGSVRCYSNFDHQWEPGFEPTALVEFGEEAAHYAWDHAGVIWWENGQFHEQVWVHHIAAELMSAPSVRALVDAVNDKYGHD